MALAGRPFEGNLKESGFMKPRKDKVREVLVKAVFKYLFSVSEEWDKMYII